MQATTERTHNNTTSFPRRQQFVDRGQGTKQPVRFAHPAEAVVADLLSSFGVSWLYEPVTFPLVTSETGSPVQCFTPDFYLPDHDVYIEMTTMRQSLVTRKNRKFRLMRELYPHVSVRLLYRKDVELIVDRYTRGRDHADLLPGLVLATSDQIAHKAAEIAGCLVGGTEPVTLIALGEGAVRFRDRIAAAFANVGVQSGNALVHVRRSRRTSPDCEAEICLASAGDLRGSRRILVADVISTGLTVNAAATWFHSAGMPIEGFVALLDRRSARLIDVPLLVPGMPAPSSWIVGAGMGSGSWARRPDIHSLLRPDHPAGSGTM